MSATESQLPQLNPSTDAADFLPLEVNYYYDFLTISLLTSKEIIYKRTLSDNLSIMLSVQTCYSAHGA